MRVLLVTSGVIVWSSVMMLGSWSSSPCRSALDGSPGRRALAFSGYRLGVRDSEDPPELHRRDRAVLDSRVHGPAGHPIAAGVLVRRHIFGQFSPRNGCAGSSRSSFGRLHRTLPWLLRVRDDVHDAGAAEQRRHRAIASANLVAPCAQRTIRSGSGRWVRRP
jgi:hypothetical protein